MTAPADISIEKNRLAIRDFFRDSDEILMFTNAFSVGAAPWAILRDREDRLVVSGPGGNPTYSVTATATGFNVRSYDTPFALLDPDAEDMGTEVGANIATIDQAYLDVLDDAGLREKAAPSP